MSSIKEVRERIRSVKNIAQITKAMEAVSATKMRKSQQFALEARPFAIAALEILGNVFSRTPSLPPLLLSRPVKTKALLIISSDKGLAGSLNTNVFRRADQWISEQKKNNLPYVLLTVGKKAKNYFERRHEPITKSFVGFGDFSKINQTIPIADTLMRGFFDMTWDAVYAVYTNFRSTMRQDVVTRHILPIAKDQIEEMVKGILPEKGKFSSIVSESSTERFLYSYEYIFEPSPEAVIEGLVSLLFRMHIHHIILESNASEHSSRMVAMKNASENAETLMYDLSLLYNKARQAGITKELTEITAGTEILEKQ